MSNLKKMLAVLLAAVSLVLMASCSNNLPMPNPFVDCKDMAEAAKISGFSMTAPETACGYEKSLIQAVEHQMVQVFYRLGGSEDQEILIRKATGLNKDVSGDYNTYASTSKIKVGGVTVTVKGADAKSVSTATWSKGLYSYAIDVTGTPLTVADVTTLVGQIG